MEFSPGNYWSPLPHGLDDYLYRNKNILLSGTIMAVCSTINRCVPRINSVFRFSLLNRWSTITFLVRMELTICWVFVGMMLYIIKMINIFMCRNATSRQQYVLLIYCFSDCMLFPILKFNRVRADNVLNRLELFVPRKTLFEVFFGFEDTYIYVIIISL